MLSMTLLFILPSCSWYDMSNFTPSLPMHMLSYSFKSRLQLVYKTTCCALQLQQNCTICGWQLGSPPISSASMLRPVLSITKLMQSCSNPKSSQSIGLLHFLQQYQQLQLHMSVTQARMSKSLQLSSHSLTMLSPSSSFIVYLYCLAIYVHWASCVWKVLPVPPQELKVSLRRVLYCNELSILESCYFWKSRVVAP